MGAEPQAVMGLVLAVSAKEGNGIFHTSAQTRKVHLASARKKLHVSTVAALRMVVMTRLFYHMLGSLPLRN